MAADVGMLFVPFGTGGGVAVRAAATAAKAEKVIYKGVQFSKRVGTALNNSSLLRTALKITDKAMEAHHIIPKSLLEKNKVVQDAVEAGFDFNGVVNGVAVKKFVKANANDAAKAGQHANHPAYTAKVESQLTAWAKKNPNYTPAQAKQYLESLSGKLKTKIQTESVKGGKKVHDLLF